MDELREDHPGYRRSTSNQHEQFTPVSVNPTPAYLAERINRSRERLSHVDGRGAGIPSTADVAELVRVLEASADRLAVLEAENQQLRSIVGDIEDEDVGDLEELYLLHRRNHNELAVENARLLELLAARPQGFDERPYDGEDTEGGDDSSHVVEPTHSP